ncbi:fructose-1,6-bisphosphatase class 1 [Candidatus Kuenenia stuttgartiensis]|jgi:fructose-1,6-bisphosphatase I|uniref:Fructose-1,6-bisphosphatase class 1 n=1 Tax=Kuenenia stuttgartiensis TaxID=174633 RepID=Q1PYS0_KUEST|nr:MULTISPECIES: class 1 fructose-bisphosphatase [Kuenenia]MBE7548573.1 class 1 fructose-bisphosphatase [Planctomycetia bacterium]MBW7943461.1 class 1 fructose-bisphosphatase [Candidatus Kuenenia stuttgartiensis]MBZ0190433.1 class 1 fructose-bisphosphatase [Candidatus Kuenenia stuttgartiensis]MCF6152273.1 class 1 fructose-bisphosphatase [Candidatus Kuenenia stuttgartiensis]MCL4726857.1 class 1 fructose-bisphosphatase [Candidatus Kuenenia stuttgartiensis]
MSGSKIITVQRHIIEQERDHPEATGELTGLLWDLTIAAKIISREVNRAGLADILGLTGQENIHGEEVKKLDEYANDVIIKSMDHGGHLCVMASEENEDIIPIPDQYPKGKYMLMFDPLDGSSNIDANVSVGTIFSIYRRKTTAGNGTLEDCLRKGVEQVAAGYIVYGSSTMLVYTAGHGSHGFTLDPGIGEFLLSHKNIQIPSRGKIYSINEGNTNTWDEGTRKYINDLKKVTPETGQKPYSLRYIGSLVADFHRTLLYGGIFLYPADYKDPNKPKSKLRLLYEAAPLAFIVEQAGGKASTGDTAIMEIKAEQLHQKTPLIIGSKEDVEKYEGYFKNK